MNPPATAASAAIPFRAIDDAALPSSSQWGVAMVLCLGALVFMLWAWRRRSFTAANWPRRPGTLIDVLETRAVGAQTQLAVVRYAGRRLLLSVGPDGTHCLRDDPECEGRQP